MRSLNASVDYKYRAYAPVLTGLYGSMGYASYLIYRDGVGEARNIALGLYAGQLVLNWTYFPVFFRFKKLGLVSRPHICEIRTKSLIAISFSRFLCYVRWAPI